MLCTASLQQQILQLSSKKQQQFQLQFQMLAVLLVFVGWRELVEKLCPSCQVIRNASDRQVISDQISNVDEYHILGTHTSLLLSGFPHQLFLSSITVRACQDAAPLASLSLSPSFYLSSARIRSY